MSAQVVATCVGGDASGSGGSISYTVGQVSYSTLKVSDITFAEGIQHPYNSKSIVNPTDTTSSQDQLVINCSVFPNPTADNVTLNIKGSNLKNKVYYLYDSGRKLVKQGSITESNTIVKMADLPTGVYLLTVRDKTKNILRIFKIIKDHILQ